MHDEARPPASTDDLRLVAALRGGDEAAFVSLLDWYHSALVRLAMIYVPSREEAEEAAQETWLGVLRGIDRFEGRSSLKTWIFRILTNQAKKHGTRAGRSVPFSAFWNTDAEALELAVEPDRFFPSDHVHAGLWSVPPRSWSGNPEERLLAGETRSLIGRAMEALPPTQRAVVTLRDVDGWTADEVCHLLEITDANQRVLLHRGRSRVRRELESYFHEG